MPNESKNLMTKIPPQNIEAEKSVLGSLMLDSKSIDVIIDILRPNDFYQTKHKIIFEAMVDLYQSKEPIDILSLSSRLKDKKQLDAAGGTSYLTELVNSVPTSSNAKHYAEIVHKKSVLRDLIESSGHIHQLGYDEEGEIDSILDEAEKKIFSIARMSTKQRFVNMKTSLMDAWERFDKLHKSKGELRGVPSGFPELDNLLAGFQKSDLIILAARPSIGKSALALDIARNVACKGGVPVGIFSLEMSTQSLVDIMQMRAKARRLQAEHGLGLIIIDYLQLMVPRQNSDNMVQQMTEISRSLKGLAKDLQVPVIALSQLNRAVELRNPPIPKLHDLRDSGSIEQDADVVMFIYREDKYKPDTDRKNIAEIHVEKHRNGPTGKIDLYFNPEKVSFSSIERGDFGQM